MASDDLAQGGFALEGSLTPLAPQRSVPQDEDLPALIERDFDRRAFLPRCAVLLVLLFGALVDYGHGSRPAHWGVLAAYGAITLAAAVAVRSHRPLIRQWMPRLATMVDAGIAVYVVADHLPRNVHDVRLGTDTISLLPAFLFLLQTGLRLRPALVVLFASLVASGWLTLILLVLHRGDLAVGDEMSVLTRQALNLAAFLAASAFVVAAVAWARSVAAAALRAREDRLLLSRFLPQGVALDVVHGGEAIEITERHACLVSVDLRGSSAMARTYASADLVSWLLEFRRIVHDAVSAHRGIIDKYVGDGVLALFLEGSPERQAGRTVAAVREAAGRLETWNAERRQRGLTPIRVIFAIHSGRVLAGVFDDGRRAEFTVLGPAMNALTRIERRAKDADVDIVASADFIRLLGDPSRHGLGITDLVQREPEAGVPAISVLSLAPRQAAATPGRTDVPHTPASRSHSSFMRP